MFRNSLRRSPALQVRLKGSTSDHDSFSVSRITRCLLSFIPSLRRVRRDACINGHTSGVVFQSAMSLSFPEKRGLRLPSFFVPCIGDSSSSSIQRNGTSERQIFTVVYHRSNYRLKSCRFFRRADPPPRDWLACTDARFSLAFCFGKLFREHSQSSVPCMAAVLRIIITTIVSVFNATLRLYAYARKYSVCGKQRLASNVQYDTKR